ncbi:uncharacterized protein B0I36DRAFT_374271 [Microdochium trichocladiopsis]|uniref:Transmembrane protein 42 n=1 Tax=Microdochium trichocladiopsis TaxID=1682393 RepID=A0A9P9BQV0_9PEZI|nr:uncharacterized protein B0I36DRAFT_374271 [Microdochium trichocladiopsis]KAH7031293.1 hypothetical protein B0I36DRAFT_374271 [Microdochium trichocladiopsis]
MSESSLTPKSSLRDSQDLKQAVPSGDTGSGEAAMSFTKRNQWVVFAVASGACAAFNGVFAKLTTNDLTTTIAKGISRLFGMPEGHVYIELVVRVIFFSLNLVFNGVMWTLFTQALAKGNSTTQVSIMNTSTNFMITALLGFIIFSESLPPLWWLGAAMLVAGNVIIGRKDSSGSADEAEEVDGAGAEGGGVLGAGAGLAAADALGEYRDDDTDVYRDDLETGRQSDDVDEDVALIGDL